jgi:hypothetical protein
LIIPTTTEATGFLRPLRFHIRRRLRVPQRLPRPLLQEALLPRLDGVRLPLLNALEPVPEETTAGHVDGVNPERLLVEEGPHLDTHLPPAGDEAWGLGLAQGE